MTRYRHLAIVFFIIAVIFGWAVLTYAATTTIVLNWDANTEPDLVGYKLYQSSTPTGTKALIQTILKPLTTATVAGLPDGSRCWVLAAFDTFGNVSGYSNQVCSTTDTVAPAIPGNLQITSTTVTTVTP